MNWLNPDLIGVSAVLDTLLSEWSWRRTFLGLLVIVLLLVAVYLVDRLVGRFVERVRSGRGPWRAGVLRLAPVVRLMLLAAAVLSIAVVAFDIHPIVLVGGLLGVVISLGFGSVDIVRNVLAGAVIGARKPFRVGDRVAVDEFEGAVVHIGLRATVLLTRDGERVVVPNRKFVSGVTVRVCIPDTGAPVRIEMRVPLEMDLAAARTLAFRAAAVSKYASARRRPEVYVLGPAGDGSHMMLEVRGYAFDGQYSDQLRGEFNELMAEGLRAVRNAEAEADAGS